MTVLFDNTLTGKEKLSSQYLLDTRSPLQFMATVRKTLEEWFVHYPSDKRKEFLSRLRIDNASYRGALLELVTHELLRVYAGRVVVEAALPSGSRPDFHISTPKGNLLWAECTVAERSDRVKGSIATATRLRDIVNAMDTRPFGLGWMLLRYSRQEQPRESSLKKHIRESIKGLAETIAGHSIREGTRFSMRDWEDRGWRVEFDAFFLPGRDRDAPAIVVDEGENAGVNDESEGWMGNEI